MPVWVSAVLYIVVTHVRPDGPSAAAVFWTVVRVGLQRGCRAEVWLCLDVLSAAPSIYVRGARVIPPNRMHHMVIVQKDARNLFPSWADSGGMWLFITARS